MNFVQTGLVLIPFKIHSVFDGEKVHLPSYCCIGHMNLHKLHVVWVMSGVTNSVRLKKYPWSFVGLVDGMLCLRLRHVYPLAFSSPHGCCLLHRFRQKSISSNTPESTMIRSNLGSEELGQIGIHLSGFHVLKNS